MSQSRWSRTAIPRNGSAIRCKRRPLVIISTSSVGGAGRFIEKESHKNHRD
jgi:hypothetical protein